MSRSCFLAAILLLATTFVGCGNGLDLPPMARVSGVVTLNGNPLPSGSVKFVPELGPAATGQIQSDGSFELITVGKKGAVIGQHKVSVSAFKQAGDGVGGMMQPLVPPRYLSYEKSGLTATVEDVRENNIPLKLISGT